MSTRSAKACPARRGRAQSREPGRDDASRTLDRGRPGDPWSAPIAPQRPDRAAEAPGIADVTRLAALGTGRRCAPTAVGAPLVRMEQVDKVYANGVQALRRFDLADRRARVREPAGPVRLRQEHGTAPDRRARARERRARRLARGAGPRHAAARRYRLRVPGADAHAVGHGLEQRLPAAAPGGHRQGGRRPARRRGARAGRAWRHRARLSARAFRRHEDAGLDRARAGHRAARAADGRAVRGPRRDHPLPAQRRPLAPVAVAQLDRGVRHPQRLRIGLSLEPHRGDGGEPGTRRRRGPDRRPLSARRGVPHLAALQPVLPRGPAKLHEAMGS